jgi:hypothetical protein
VVITQPPVVITQPPIVITQPPIIITQPVPVPPPVIIPLSTAVPSPAGGITEPITPPYGWTRYESNAFIQVVGHWRLRTNQNASDGAYYEVAASGALLRFAFEGDGIRLGFRVRSYGGDFQMRLDNELLDAFSATLVDGNAEHSVMTREYFVDPGYHVLDLYISRVPENGAVGIDFVEIFTGPPLPVQVDDMSGQQDVVRVELVSAPPTPAPTATAIPEQPLIIEVLVAYDENANGSADLNEGVRDVSVRVLDALTGDLLVSNFTGAQGSLRLQVLTAHDVVVYIPLLGQSLTIRLSQHNRSQRWQVLLPAGNQPGLIP